MSWHYTQAIAIPIERELAELLKCTFIDFKLHLLHVMGWQTGVVEQSLKLGCEISVLQFWLAFNFQQRNQFTSHVLNVGK